MEKDFFELQVTQPQILERAIESFDLSDFCPQEQSPKEVALFTLRWMLGFYHGILNTRFAIEDTPISSPYSMGYGEGQAQRQILCLPESTEEATDETERVEV